ncbi:MAG: MerR family transcriptional regulator [Myxococcaceae bacterium]|nr:MerR family transcriptional regulator [Myxococcaceae bacterium]
MDILKPEELEQIERDHAAGLPARAILEIFRPRGVRLSEATFRKYVQAGLLPRSKRVGRKGKHRGSQGLYPVESVRRINVIKKMMAEGLTLEDIRRSFVFFKNHLDQIARDFSVVVDGLTEEIDGRAFEVRARRELHQELDRLRVQGAELVRSLGRLGSQITARHGAGVSLSMH